MPGTSRLLSELESAAIAGVSVETIRQFRGCGLLEPVRDDGKERFREIDIKTLFYNRTKQNTSPASGDAPAPPTAGVQAVPPQPTSQSADKSEGQSADKSDGQFDDKSEGSEVPPEPTPQESRESAKPGEETTGERPVEAAQAKVTESSAAETDTTSGAATATAAAAPASSANLPALSSISTDHLIETNKGLREQLEILRGERDWLRARVEKLETRSEREQMLLLSESENIRKLIQQGEQKKNSWLRALPWFGKE